MGGSAIGAGGGTAAADYFACMRTVRWDAGRIVMIDQTGLPAELVFAGYGDYRQAAGAIRRLVVRGAPAIGVSGAFGLELAARRSGAPSAAGVVRDLEEAAAVLVATRPTAVNFKRAVDCAMAAARSAAAAAPSPAGGPYAAAAVRGAAVAEASAMADEDMRTDRALGRNGAALFGGGDTVTTHCDAGALATVGYGTAPGVARAARDGGKGVRAIATGTAPSSRACD